MQVDGGSWLRSLIGKPMPMPGAGEARTGVGGDVTARSSRVAGARGPAAATDAKDGAKRVQSSGGGGDIPEDADLTVKGKHISAEQRENLDTVLDVGARMGANENVLRSAVATVIQESVAVNMEGGDRDSQGLFQQRPSQGWGTPDQVRDPEHAATKYFEQAIANDRKHPDQSLAELAQSVQISAFPDAYAQWAGEAQEIVAAWRG
jgi:hypothetical protein